MDGWIDDWCARVAAASTLPIAPTELRAPLMALGRLMGRCPHGASAGERAATMRAALDRHIPEAGASLVRMLHDDRATWLPRLGAPELDHACGLRAPEE